MARLTYEQWLAEVDEVLVREVGMVADEMMDWPSRDAYEDGLTPVQGAARCLKAQD